MSGYIFLKPFFIFSSAFFGAAVFSPCYSMGNLASRSLRIFLISPLFGGFPFWRLSILQAGLISVKFAIGVKTRLRLFVSVKMLFAYNTAFGTRYIHTLIVP